jgi:hypothetical protein
MPLTRTYSPTECRRCRLLDAPISASLSRLASGEAQEGFQPQLELASIIMSAYLADSASPTAGQ